MELIADLALIGLAGAAGLCLLRVLRGPSLAERMVALDVLVLVVVSGIGVDVARQGDAINVDVLVVASLLGFVGTALTARFLEGLATDDG
ncbi:MAG: monovalent cation/H+ antiporter complex subunit F [Acidimicrobiales bacterium]